MWSTLRHANTFLCTPAPGGRAGNPGDRSPVCVRLSPPPLTDPETLCEALLQDLPPEAMQMARAFNALVRAKKFKTPAQLLRVVFFYCGLDKPCREVAGIFTALSESITDQAVAERLRACGP